MTAPPNQDESWFTAPFGDMAECDHWEQDQLDAAAIAKGVTYAGAVMLAAIVGVIVWRMM